jgi:[acyl-carrier-protein] S-malonyltransferase
MNNIAFLFPGQGAQYVGMGKSLYEQFSQARTLFDRANELLGFDLKSVCFEGPEDALTQTAYCQPAIFVHSYCVYQILSEHLDVSQIKAVLGLSLGEITALTAAKVFDFETGLTLVAKRAEWMQEACEQTQGGMASLIGGSLELAEALCKKHVIQLANLNCPGQIVISGPIEKLEPAIQEAHTVFKKVISLKVAGAYHSHLMASASEKLNNYVQSIPFEKPATAFISNVTGEQLQDPQLIQQLLPKQVVSSVLWESSVQSATALGIQTFIECGPGTVLTGLGRRIHKEATFQSLGEAEALQAYIHQLSSSAVSSK